MPGPARGGSLRARLGAAHSGGCSACIDRIGTLGVLPQSLTPPARATPSLVQELWVTFPDGRAQAGGGAPGVRVSDCGSIPISAKRSMQALQRAEGVSPP